MVRTCSQLCGGAMHRYQDPWPRSQWDVSGYQLPSSWHTLYPCSLHGSESKRRGRQVGPFPLWGRENIPTRDDFCSYSVTFQNDSTYICHSTSGICPSFTHTRIHAHTHTCMHTLHTHTHCRENLLPDSMAEPLVSLQGL